MFAAYFCIRDDHDVGLVALAALICIAVSVTSVLLLRHARAAGRQTRLRWGLAAGTATGFGVWATHFVAMLGYDPGVVIGYDLPLTALSLAAAIVTAVAGFGFVLSGRGRARLVTGAAAVGLGIAAMHYLGMLAAEFPGSISWSYPLVAASVLFAVLPMIGAIRLAMNCDGAVSALGAAGLIACAILLLHFTGMAGLTVLPGRGVSEAALLLSPMAMGLTIGFTALVLLIMFIIAALINARARSAIAGRQREFSMLVQNVKDCAITMLDREGRVSSWNAGAERLTGYRENDVIGQPAICCARLEGAAEDDCEVALATARQEGSYQGAGWVRRKDGTRFWAHVLMERLHDESGAFIGYARLIRDMSRLRQDQERLAALTNNLDAALSHMHQGLGLFDAEERLVLFNGQIEKIFGCGPGVIHIGMHFREILRIGIEMRDGAPVSPQALHAAAQRHNACRMQPGGGVMTVPFVDDRALLIAHRPMAAGGWVTTLEDITERRRAERRIEYMALHDGLTGLANRTHFSERLEDALAAARRDGKKVAVVGIDLDRFKEINDTHGHDAGDRLLCEMADRLRATLHRSEFVGRPGGDEFSAFKVLTDDADLPGFVRRLQTALTTPVILGDWTVTPGASLGVALFPRDGDELEQLARNADLAMYCAKASLNRKISYYEQGMDEAARERRMLSTDLKGAAARGEMSLAYQVQRSVLNQEVVGYEALLRWNHPSAGPIPPDQFIPIAEESGEIVRLGEWVLRTACSEAARWPQPWRVAVNLSPVQLMNVDLVELVTQALLDSGLPPRRLELEITETALIGDKTRALHTLRQIKALGVSIAIDDFGTGYSSLDTLHSFPFDKIKIDKSFLIESARSPQARAIIRAVLALGQSLHLPVLAEGLESAEQLELLKLEGCAEAQGYFFGKPGLMSQEEIESAPDEGPAAVAGADRPEEDAAGRDLRPCTA